VFRWLCTLPDISYEFAKLDVNGDGTLTRDELVMAVMPYGPQWAQLPDALFALCDVDGDGRIRLAEFQGVAQMLLADRMQGHRGGAAGAAADAQMARNWARIGAMAGRGGFGVPYAGGRSVHPGFGIPFGGQAGYTIPRRWQQLQQQQVQLEQQQQIAQQQNQLRFQQQQLEQQQMQQEQMQQQMQQHAAEAQQRGALQQAASKSHSEQRALVMKWLAVRSLPRQTLSVAPANLYRHLLNPLDLWTLCLPDCRLSPTLTLSSLP
jgi:hypothetical protein